MFWQLIILLNDFGGVENIFDGDVHSGEQFSFPMNLASYWSEYMDVPECTDVIMNVYAANCFLEHDRLGGGVMVWEGIRHDGRTPLVRVNGAPSAQIYLDEIPEHHVVPLINVTGGIFHHDNVRPYTAWVSRDFLQQNNVHVLPWDILDRRVR